MARVKPVPEGYHTITPYIAVNDAAAAIEFYKRAFGATEVMRMPGPDGKIGHADLMIGDSHIMLADEYAPMDFRAPGSVGGSPVMMHLYVDDVNRWFDRAVKAGAKVTRPLETQFYGDRGGALEDPFGHRWYLSSRVEEVSPEEMKRRAAQMAASH